MEKDIYAKVEEIQSYLDRAKIPNLPKKTRESIEHMIIDGRTYAEIMAYSKNVKQSVSGAQIKKHKDFMPMIARLFPERTAYQLPQENKGEYVNVPKEDYNTLNFLRESLRSKLLPGLMATLEQKVGEEERHQIGFRDGVDSLEKLVKIDQLLGGEPTEISKVSHNVSDFNLRKDSMETLKKMNEVLMNEQASRGGSE